MLKKIKLIDNDTTYYINVRHIVYISEIQGDFRQFFEIAITTGEKLLVCPEYFNDVFRALEKSC